MLFVENNNTDPYQNHALEEWLMDHLEEECFMLWRNQKAILLGRNQNAYSEINMPYALAHQIKIVRRITGGGTVFTDRGNIMFTFISKHGSRDFADFKRFTTPIVTVLCEMGIPARFSGRNDLLAGDRKISGNAQCRYKDKLLHHGTLMYDADVEELAKALNVKEIKLRSKGVTSVKSRVGNLADYLPVKLDIEEFREQLFQQVFEQMPDSRLYRLSDTQWDEVRNRSLEKHATKEWIYGKNPVFDIKKETRLSGGIVEVYLNIEKGKITDLQIYGDFFSNGEMNEVEAALKGVLYERDALQTALERFSNNQYFGAMTAAELTAAFL